MWECLWALSSIGALRKREQGTNMGGDVSWKVLARKRYLLKAQIFQTQKHCVFCFALLYLKRKLGKDRCGKAGARFRALQVRATLEHIVPISRGGTDDPYNLTLSCNGCNQKRSSTGFIEFAHSAYVQRKRGFVLRTREFRFHSNRAFSKTAWDFRGYPDSDKTLDKPRRGSKIAA